MKKLKFLLFVAFVLIFTPVFVSAAFNTSLEVYYSFDDADQTSGNPGDLTDNGVIAIRSGATTGVSGKINEAYQYDGSNDYVNVTDFFSGGSQASYNFWMKLDTTTLPETYGVPFGYTDGGGDGLQILMRDSDNTMWSYTKGTSTATSSPSAGSLSFNTSWVMVTYVYDGSNAKLYINNDLKGNVAHTTNINDPNVVATIGKGSDQPAWRHFDGIIDEFAFWSKSLNTTEVSNLWNDGEGCDYYCITNSTVASPASTNATERLQQNVIVEQNGTVSVNSITYVPIVSAGVTASGSGVGYAVATIPITATASNSATCRINYDGGEFLGSEATRTLTAGSSGNLILSSRVDNITAGAHTLGVDCYRTGGGAFSVENTTILGHLLVSPDGDNLTYKEFNATGSVGDLFSTTLTTSENATQTNLTRAFVMEWTAALSYSATGNITLTPELAGVNCSSVIRYGASGSTGSAAGSCYVGELINDTSYTIKLHTSGASGTISSLPIIKEFIIHPEEINQTSLTGTSISGTTLNVANVTISTQAGHSTPDAIVSASLNPSSNTGTNTATFFLQNGENSSTISRTVGEGQPGSVLAQKTYSSVTNEVFKVIATCADCSLVGGDFLAYLSSDFAATPNEFIVTAANIYDTSQTFNEFSINISDGRSFSTTNGQIVVSGAGELYNITISENSGASIPYFANYTLNHNSTADIQLNTTPYTKINVTGNATVSNFSVNGSSTTNGALYLRLFNDTYTFEAYDITDDNGADYANTTATFSASPYLEYYTYVPKYSNTINISFYDEETGSLLSGTTVYFEAISDSQAGNYTTSTGVLTESFLLPDSYTFRYNALGYEESFYSLTIADRSFNALNLTLLNSTSATEVTLTVYDTLGNTLEDATVKVLKYDVASNAYFVTEILNTNFEGVATANIVLNSEYYKFIIDYDGETRLTTSPTYIYGTSLTFYIPISTSGMEDLFDQVAISGQINYNYATNLAVFTYSDTENAASQGCLYAYTRSAGTNTLVNSSCVSSSSGSLNLPAFNSSSTWVFEGKVTKGGNTYLISTYRVDFAQRLNETGSGALFAFLVLATVVFIGLFSLEVAVVLASAVPLLFTVTKLADFDYIISVPILLLGLVVAFIIGSNKK